MKGLQVSKATLGGTKLSTQEIYLPASASLRDPDVGLFYFWSVSLPCNVTCCIFSIRWRDEGSQGVLSDSRAHLGRHTLEQKAFSSLNPPGPMTASKWSLIKIPFFSIPGVRWQGPTPRVRTVSQSVSQVSARLPTYYVSWCVSFTLSEPPFLHLKNDGVGQINVS